MNNYIEKSKFYFKKIEINISFDISRKNNLFKIYIIIG